ncbi:MAG: helix-turn-helix transcriptional regulator [Rhodospirillales bacterium]|nr:helix-turn-helix transcriptional regulator [Rhodospirillales bacterium]
MIKGYQIRAARALIDWSLKDVETACGITGQTVSNYEVGRSTLNAANLEKLIQCFEKEGVEFTDKGVQLKGTPIYYHDSPTWYLDLLDDAYHTVVDSEHPEILIENVDDKKSPPAVIKKMKKIRDSGVNFKMTAPEGETFLLAPSSCYRFIPAAYFKNWVVMLFGNKAAFSINNETRCMVIEDENMVNAMRNRFNLLWEILPELKIESTAHERI